MPTTLLAADAHLHILGDEGVVFSESTQNIYRFNTAATCMWIHAEAGETDEGLARALASLLGCDAQTATGLVASSLGEWRKLGLLASPREAPSPSPEPPPATEISGSREVPAAPVSADTVAEHHYRFLDAAITVQYRDAAAYAYTAPVLAGLEVPEADVSAIPCQLTRNDRGKLTFVMGGEVCVESLDPDAVAPAVLAAFANHAVRRSDFLMLVHGGVVSNGESAVLLPASAGSGKTTLTAALCHSGLEYLSDEVVLLQREACRVRPAPIPMCVKQPSWSLIGKRYPQLYDQPVHRRMDRQVVRYLAPPVAPGAVTGPLPVSHIVFPKYQAESPTHLEKLSPMAALARLLSECRGAGSALTQTDIAALVQWIAEVTCYSLSLGDLDEAVGVLMGAVFE